MMGNKGNLELIGMGDALYKVDEHPLGGDMIFIKEANSSRESLGH